MGDDRVYLLHIGEALQKIERYLKDIEKKAFLKNELLIDGVIRELEIIGEAANNVSVRFQEKHSEIPWRSMRNMRNFLVHEYFGVDPQIVWQTVTEDLPPLRVALQELFRKI